jgi:hypothetical protein
MRTLVRQAVLAAVGGIALTAAAMAAPVAAEAAPATQHCVTVLGELDARTGYSTVVSRTCGPQAEAAVPAASTRLVDIFYDINYGRFLDTFYGNFGTCDSSGYHIGLPAYDGNNMSSIKGYGGCNASGITNRQGSTEYVRLPDPWIGGAYSDNVSGIHPYHV